MKSFGMLAIVLMVTVACLADDDQKIPDLGDVRENVEESIGEAVENAGDFFKGASDTARDAAESAADTIKEGGEFGLGIVKGFAGGIMERLGNARDKLVDVGGKMKTTVEKSATNVKDEVESAADKVSEYSKGAMDHLKSFVD